AHARRAQPRARRALARGRGRRARPRGRRRGPAGAAAAARAVVHERPGDADQRRGVAGSRRRPRPLARRARPALPARLRPGDGRLLGTVLVDGFVAGTWSMDDRGLLVTPFGRLSRADREGLAAEGERLLDFATARRKGGREIRFGAGTATPPAAAGRRP